MPRYKSVICTPGYRKGQPNPNKGRRFYPETYTREEFEAMREACNCGASGIRDRALITFLYRTGARVSEALGVRLHDIDFDRQLIRIHGTKTRTADRVVGMHPDLAAHLRDWLDIRQAKGIPPTGHVFCCISRHERGNPVKPAQARQKLKLLATKAGISKRVHPHGFRHTFASEMAGERADIRIVSKALGHSNIAITDRYVSHLNPTEVIEYMAGRN